MAKVFISYRRADSAASSGRIYDRLVQRFKKQNVFKDVDNIPVGVRFGDYILDSLRQCAAVLVIIGRGWLDARGTDGSRRLDDPGDFVRLEVETALALGLVVIPVLVEGASIPATASLPESLRDLSQINAVEVRNDPDFSRDIERVVEALDRVFAQRRRAPTAPRPLPAMVVTPTPPLAPAVQPAPVTQSAEPASAAQIPTNQAAIPVPARVQPAVARPAIPFRSGRDRWRMIVLPALAVVLVASSLSVLLLQKHGSDLAAADAQHTQVANTHVAQTAVAQIVHFPYHAAAPGPGCDKGNGPWIYSFNASQSDVECATTYTRIVGSGVHIKWVGDQTQNSSLPLSYTVSVQVSHLSNTASAPAGVDMSIETNGGRDTISYEVVGEIYSSLCVAKSRCSGGTYSVNASGTYTLSITINGTHISAAVDNHTFSSATQQDAVTTQAIDLDVRNLNGSSATSPTADFSNFTIIAVS